MLTKTDMHYFDKASQVAEISDFAKINIGCVAVYQGTIIGVGFNTNKTHPMQKKYNRYRNGENFIPKLHAEINCLNSIRYLDINYTYTEKENLQSMVCAVHVQVVWLQLKILV